MLGSSPPVFPRVCSNSRPLNLCCYLTILSSSTAAFSFAFHLSQYQSFSMSHLFTSGSQSYWYFSFSIGPSIEYSGLISFRIDCFYLLAVQSTLKSLNQYHNSKASILWHSAWYCAIHEHWKNYSIDYIDLCQKSDVSAF